MSANPVALPMELLRQGSRSFYTTLRILPAAVRPQIGLAYLLARATDTIADSALVSLEQRLGALRRLRGRIGGFHQDPLGFGRFEPHQGSAAEKVLLERVEEILSILGRFSSDDQRVIREVLQTITSGQELDLTRFAGASGERIVALATDEELDDYTYRVAGCVGQFWTRICRTHLFPEAPVDEPRFLGG